MSAKRKKTLKSNENSKIEDICTTKLHNIFSSLLERLNEAKRSSNSRKIINIMLIDSYF
jgi:hypothetical protein